MKSEKLIPASWFYRKDFEKIKLNWFIYELALMHFDHIEACRNKAFKKWKSRRTDRQIAEFCAYYAKRTKPGWIDYLDGNGDLDEFRLSYITDYCHDNTLAETDILIEHIGRATADKLATCRACSYGCFREPYMECEFFDRMERGGYIPHGG
jgi:hypothetical protein